MRRSRRSVVTTVAFAFHAAALITTPLRPRGRRAGLASLVVAGLGVTTAGVAGRRWGSTRAVAALGAVGAGTLAVERIGTRTGRPFGRYAYTPVLRPRVGGVPAVVPLAWFAMAVPAREVARAIDPRWRVPLGAALLTAWDLFLDPQMVGEGYWYWPRGGRYRGIPLSNFAGWFVTAVGVMIVLEVTLPARGRADRALVGEYAWMAVMETAGFAAFFDDRVVAAVGGAAMLPPAAVALSRVLRCAA